jgi:hypothetical protein
MWRPVTTRNGGRIRKAKRVGNNLKNKTMAKTISRPINAPSTTGKPSGGGRGNNPPSPKPKGK